MMLIASLIFRRLCLACALFADVRAETAVATALAALTRRLSRVAVPALALLTGIAVCGLSTSALAADDFLAPEVAFKASARAVDPRTIEVIFEIAPGYYLYRDQFRFESTDGSLGAPAIPAGHVKFDTTFQKNVETYRDTLRIAVPVATAPRDFTMTVGYQGCADKGLCYPPTQVVVQASLAAFGGSGIVRAGPARDAPPGAGLSSAVGAAMSTPAGAPQSVAAAVTGSLSGRYPVEGHAGVGRSGSAVLGAITGPVSTGLTSEAASEQVARRPGLPIDRLDGALRDGRSWIVIAVFFAAGVLLSLTPCVLPMLPILSSIIVGHGTAASRGRGLMLAGSYSLGMAMVYTALGIAAGLAGEGLAAALQTPWVLGGFAAMLVVFALSMFGAFELQLPTRWTGSVTAASRRLPAGRIAGVFLMGGVSALIVSPCVAAPLAGALVYISQTRDVVLGGAALFSLAAGMSVPLLLVGASAGALLPRAGAWMDGVKRVFGVLLLAVALWTVQSVVPGPLALGAWGALSIGAAVMLAGTRPAAGARPAQRLARRAAATVVGVFGLLQLVGAASGGSDPLQPLIQFKSAAGVATRASGSSVAFVRVRSVAELDAVLRTSTRPVMLDFYADWCVSCKEMDRFTFSDPVVGAKLAGAVLLQADVTANNADDRALLKRFALFGPPGTLFFDRQGQEIAAARVVGYQDTTRFLSTLAEVGL